MTGILIVNGTIVTLNRNRDIIHNGSLFINKGKIIDIGKRSDLEKKYTYEEKIDAKNKIILPGFVNVHTHVDNILFRGGLGQDRYLDDWLENLNFPGVWALKAEDCRIAAALYCQEAMLSGITTIVDNSTWGMGGPKAEEIAIPTIETYKKIGIRAIYGRMIGDQFPPELETSTRLLREKEPDTVHVPIDSLSIESPDNARKETSKLINRYHLGKKGLIQIWPNPVKTSFNSTESLKMALELAEEYDTMVMLHLDESEKDAFFDKIRYGMSSVEYLDSIGFLNERLLAGHCVWVDERDIRILKRKNVKIAHLPICNMYLGSGIAPIVEMLNSGLVVALGTDDACASDTVSMISSMKFAALLQKVKTLDASSITAEKVLEMSTIDAAKALGMEKLIGSIEVSKKADVIILDSNYPNLKPMHHIPSAIVYQAYGNEVDTVIIDGKIVMKERKIASIEELYGDSLLVKAQKASEAIIDRAGMQKQLDRGWKTIRSSQYP